MLKNSCLLFIFIILLPSCLFGQQSISGQVFDARTMQSIPFATIRFGNTGQGMVAALNGSFEVPSVFNNIDYIEISYLGYKTKKLEHPSGHLMLFLETDDKVLGEIEVKPPYEKMRRIINAAIAHKNTNNPDKYDWYRCHVYYKMLVDATLPDSILNDTSKDGRETKEFFDRQHLLMSETYSIRTWRKPRQLQEDVLASRFSGLKKSVFTSLVTSIVPFHAYDDYIKLNGTDFHNPVSKGFEQYYRFNLSDEFMQGDDTVWVLSFRPKGLNANNLTGSVYINSSGYAISQIIARANDTMLKLNVRIEQQYAQLALTNSTTRWFPEHLNYVIDWDIKSGKTSVTYHIKGNSSIDSIDFTEEPDFRFDKAHTVRLQGDAAQLPDSTWRHIRPTALAPREAETYRFIDSIGEKYKADMYMGYLSELPDGKVPVGPVDVDLKRLASGNKYENVRLGLGLQTNAQVLKWGSLGAWAGYGFEDAHWKYGVFAEVYGDRYKESVARISYTDDLAEPGRIRLNRDLDKTYLKMYLLRRVDQVKAFTASVRKKIGYWNFELSGSNQEIIPHYHYMLEHNSTYHSRFTANEASLSIRYAYGEHTAPIFSYYTRTGTRFPILYAKLTTGAIDGGSGYHASYTQALAAVQWHKHINRVGFEHILIECGGSWSNAPLPLSKLFAGNGFKYDSKSDIGLYAFGGLMAMYPYEYYSDRFINIIYRHDIDWKLYKLQDKKFIFSSAPNLCLQYNMLYGSLADPGAQSFAAFKVPDNAYHEGGILLNNLLRMRVFNLYYLTQSIGYFYHLDFPFDNKKNGRVVFGVGLEL